MDSAQKFLFPYLICLLLGACTPQQEPASGLLWKITTAEGKESYLFGTIHVYPQGRITINTSVLEALRTCRVLATERNVRNEEDQRLFAEQNQHKTGARAYQVINRHYGGRLKSMEGELLRLADRQRIPVSGLETARELLDLLGQIPVPLEDSLIDSQIIASYEQLIRIYNSGQIDSLTEEMLDQELGAETRKLLVDQRNLNWLDDIDRLIQPGGAFIAVGMGHLGGQHGLVHLLRQKGYRLENLKP